MKWLDDKIRQILHEEVVNRNSTLLNAVNRNLEDLNINLKSILVFGAGSNNNFEKENLELKKKLARLEGSDE